jgi:hypothetical protein
VSGEQRENDLHKSDIAAVEDADQAHVDEVGDLVERITGRFCDGLPCLQGLGGYLQGEAQDAGTRCSDAAADAMSRSEFVPTYGQPLTSQR